MLAVNTANVGQEIKEWCDKVSNGETVVISHSHNKNIYMIDEAEYNELQKAKKNDAYRAMLDESEKQLQRGQTISLTLEELKGMESEDWKPTEKVLEFERKHGIER